MQHNEQPVAAHDCTVDVVLIECCAVHSSICGCASRDRLAVHAGAGRLADHPHPGSSGSGHGLAGRQDESALQRHVPSHSMLMYA